MYKYKIILSYDGSCFGGWQVQANYPSIQGCLQETFSHLTNESLHIIGSGRTDAGVHAKGQVAHFSTKKLLSHDFLDKANHILPPKIRLLSVQETDLNFHARFNALQKTYHYYITTHSVVSPFESRYRTHVFDSMDLSLLKEALIFFIGTHDFSSFTNKKIPPFNPIKTIHSLQFISEGEGRFRFEFKGNGFLYKMVRNIVGTLICIAQGKISMHDLPKIFEAKDRRLTPAPAPPQGLFLMSVLYNN